MKYFKLYLISLLLTSSAFAYTDNDIDGVDDNVDQCLNTPFDVLVGENGCAFGKTNNGALTLKVGTDISFNTSSDASKNLNFFANYRYNNWDVSLSNSNYTTYDSVSGGSSESGDLYLSTGYLFKNDALHTKLSLGSKLATADEGVGTGENDYFASLNLNYYLGQKQDFFLYYGYTMSGDSATIDYEDFSSISIGTGYAMSDRWYSGISYDYSGTNVTDGDSYKALSWFNSYAFSEKLFATVNYAHGLDDFSYDHTISLKLGVYFE